MGCRWTSGIHRVPLDRSIDRAHLSIPTVRTVRGCDNPLEIGAIAMGRIPCSAHGGRNRGWRGAEYYYIRPPRCTYVRTYVRSTYTRVLRISWTLERRLEGGGRACTAPQPSGAHLLVRRSAARYLQRRANSWRGLLASLVTTVFSSWSTSIDLWSIVNARLIERAWVARPCTLALPARPASLPSTPRRGYTSSLFFFIPLLLAPSFLALPLAPCCCLPSAAFRPSPTSGIRDTGFIGFPFSSFHSFASFSRWPMFRFDQWILLLLGERLWRGRTGEISMGKGLKESRVSRFWWRNWVLNGLKKRDSEQSSDKVISICVFVNLIVYSLFFFFFFYFEIMLAQFILYDYKIVRFILICFLSFCHNCDIAGKTIDTIVLHSLKIVLKNLCLKFRSLKIRSRIR